MPDDYLDLDALEVEEEGTPFVFKFDGVEYSMPVVLDMRAVAKIEVGALEDFLCISLGVAQWEQLCGSPKLFGPKTFEKILSGYFNHVGVDMGKLRGSTGSSGRTAGPSKRTSSGSTASRSRR